MWDSISYPGRATRNKVTYMVLRHTKCVSRNVYILFLGHFLRLLCTLLILSIQISLSLNLKLSVVLAYSSLALLAACSELNWDKA